MSEYEAQCLVLQEWGNWITITSAVATFFVSFAALFIALYGERIRQWLRKPKLSLELAEQNYNIARNEKHNIEEKRWYYLVSVQNDKPSAPAENVGVFLISVYRKLPDGG